VAGSAAAGVAGTVGAWGSVTDAVAAGAGAAGAAAGVAAPVKADARPCSIAGAFAGEIWFRNGMFGMLGSAGAGAGTGSAEALALNRSAAGTAQAAAITLVANDFLGKCMVLPIRGRNVFTEATELLKLLK
jgi:hypothetical protein